MDKNTIIRVEGLGKRYRLGQQVDLSRTFRETLMDIPRFFSRKAVLAAKQVLSKEQNRNTPKGTFWALRDVSFEVQKGDVIGIIGRNGAGKSTLLKILSRITIPTEGFAEIQGRVGSLLEVGTGFHHELTGRENIFLNGAILGMTKAEIESKFDEIVSFAEVERFLDTPVKRYSSGMRVRLGFSVAAHLDPEVLVIDEVLAVGDAEFQKKCLGKMGEVAKCGRTVLFVSHNMGAIAGLCTKCIYLKSGQIHSVGNTEDIISEYLLDYKSGERSSLADRKDRRGNGKVRITDLKFIDAKTRQPVEALISGQEIFIEMAYESTEASVREIENFNLGLGFFTTLGQFLVVFNSEMASNAFEKLPAKGRVYCHVPKFPLMTGMFSVTITLRVNGVISDQIKEAVTCNVETGSFFGTGIPNAHGRQGVYVEHSWQRNID